MSRNWAHLNRARLAKRGSGLFARDLADRPGSKVLPKKRKNIYTLLPRRESLLSRYSTRLNFVCFSGLDQAL